VTIPVFILIAFWNFDRLKSSEHRTILNDRDNRHCRPQYNKTTPGPERKTTRQGRAFLRHKYMHEPTKALDNKTKSHQCKTGTGPSEQRSSAANNTLGSFSSDIEMLSSRRAATDYPGSSPVAPKLQVKAFSASFREPMRRVTSSRPGLAVALLVLGLLEFA
jgi:hypothetical protein